MQWQMQWQAWRQGRSVKLSGRHTRAQAGVVAALALTTLISLLCSGAAQAAGFQLDRSRVVLMETARGGASVAALNGLSDAYLIQSRVTQADSGTGLPVLKPNPAGLVTSVLAPQFLVTPPLGRAEAGRRLLLRILPVSAGSLPHDRESVAYLSVKAIPSVSGPDTDISRPDAQDGKGRSRKAGTPAPFRLDSEEMRAMSALEMNIKLFWRPDGLSATAIYDGEVSKKLTVRADGEHLRFTNPTPYYATFSLLRVNGRVLDANVQRLMLPPKGEQIYTLPDGVSPAGRVEWALIDEYGNDTPVNGITL